MIPVDEFKTIDSEAEGFFKDRGSKFFSFVIPVKTDEEVAENRTRLRKKFHDARHHVYAFILGADQKNFRASDDGEPSNSSGPPVLGQIRSAELTDVLVVVIRYFGGTKLGVPGLINAYRSAAEDAISNAEIITKTIESQIEIKFDYPLMSIVMRTAKDLGLRHISQDFQMDCKIVYAVKLSDTERVISEFKDIYGTEVNQIV